MSDIFEQHRMKQAEASNLARESLIQKTKSDTPDYTARAEAARQELQANKDRYAVTLAPEEYEILNNAISNAEIPEDEAYRWASALEMSKQFGIEISDAYRNLEEYSAAIWGKEKGFVPKTNFKAIVDYGTLGVNTVKQGQLGVDLMAAEIAGDEEKIQNILAQIDAIDQENISLQDAQDRRWYIEALKFGAQSAPFTGYVATAGLLGGLVSGGLGTGLAFAASMQLASGQEYIDLRREGATKENALAMSVFSGSLQAVVETAMGNVAGTLGKNALGAGAKEAISEKLTGQLFKRLHYSGTFKQLAVKMGTEYVKENFEEGMEEVVQDLISKGTHALAAELEDYEIEPMTAESIAKDAWENFYGGIMGSLVLGLGSTAINTAATAKDYKAIKDAASIIPSEEGFKKAVENSPVFENYSEEEKAEAIKNIYKNNSGARDESIQKSAEGLAEAFSADERMEAFTVETDEDGNEIPGTAEEVTEEVRDEDGKLYNVISDPSENEDGTYSTEMTFGDPNKENANNYGYIEATINDDNNTVTIDSFKTSKERGYLRNEMFADFANNFSGYEIKWDPKTDYVKGLKEEITALNPRGKDAGLNYFEISGNTDQTTRVKIAQELRSNLNSQKVTNEMIAPLVAEFEALGNTFGLSVSDFYNQTFNGNIFGDVREAQESALSQGKGAIRGGIKIDDSAKTIQGLRAVIYAAENADFSTFSHELAHLGRRMAEVQNGVLSEEINNAFGIDENGWTREKEELFAEAFEDYLHTGEAKTPGLKELFQKLAEFLVRTYHQLHDKITLSDDMKNVYDQLLKGDADVLRMAEEAVKNGISETSENVTQENNAVSDNAENITKSGENITESEVDSEEEIELLSDLNDEEFQILVDSGSVTEETAKAVKETKLDNITQEAVASIIDDPDLSPEQKSAAVLKANGEDYIRKQENIERYQNREDLTEEEKKQAIDDILNNRTTERDGSGFPFSTIENGKDILFQEEDGKYIIKPEELNRAEEILADPLKYSEKERKRIKENLKKHDGTAYKALLVYSINIHDDIVKLMNGEEIAENSAISRFTKVIKYLKNGEQGLFDYLECKSSMLSEPDKCVNAVSSSAIHCNPSPACAKYCYVATGTGQYANTIMKSEMVDLAISLNPQRAADIVAAQYRRTEEGRHGYELRILDRGDLSESWIPFIERLNERGVSVQVFSKRPEFLSRIDKEKNIVLLSIDSTNEELAAEYPELPLALVVQENEGELVNKYKDRFIRLNGVILPVKASELTKARKFTLVKNMPQWAIGGNGKRGYICPIDAEWKKIGDGSDHTWNCTKCDKVGWGCFIHRSLEERPKLASSIIESTVGELNEYFRKVEDLIRQSFPAASEEQIRRLIESYAAINNTQFGNTNTGGTGTGPARRDESLPGSSEVRDGTSRVSVDQRRDELLDKDKNMLFQEMNTLKEEGFRELTEEESLALFDDNEDIANEAWARSEQFEKHNVELLDKLLTENKGIMLYKDDDDRFYTISKNVKDDTGKWQLTYWDEKGPWGHKVFDKPESALDELKSQININNIHAKNEKDEILFQQEEYDPRKTIPKVRGGWNKNKILKYLKTTETPSGINTAARIISEFESPEELKEHMFYHGTANGASGLKPSITFNDRDIERLGGGGYGEKYWSISVSKSKKVASNFAPMSNGVRIYPILLAKNAKVKELNNISDSIELEDIIEDLWNEGIDAVWIGDGKNGGGEQELSVLNPNAIINVGEADWYKNYQLGSENNPINIKNDDQIKEMYDFAKEYVSTPHKESDFGKPKKDYSTLPVWPEYPSYMLTDENGNEYKNPDYEQQKEDYVRLKAEREEAKRRIDKEYEDAVQEWWKTPEHKAYEEYRNKARKQFLFQTDEDILNEAAQFDSWQEYRDFMEATDMEGKVPQDAGADWYLNTWEIAHNVSPTTAERNAAEMQERKTERDAARRDPVMVDAEWYTMIQKPGNLENFLKNVYQATHIDEQEMASLNADEAAYVQDIINRAERMFHHGVYSGNIRRVMNGKELTPKARSTILTLFGQRKHDYRAIYADITGQSEYAVERSELQKENANIAKDALRYKLITYASEIDAMSPEEKTKLLNQIKDESIRAKFKDDKVKMIDPDVDHYISMLEEDIKKRNKELAELRTEFNDDVNRFASKQERDIIKQYEEFLKNKVIANSKNITLPRGSKHAADVGERYKRQVEAGMDHSFSGMVMDWDAFKTELEANIKTQERLRAENRISELKQQYDAKRMDALIKKADRIHNIRQKNSQDKAELRAANQLRNMRTRLVKRVMKRVNFNTVDYNRAKEIIAIQKVFDPNLRGGVNKWIGTENKMAREIWSAWSTDSEAKEKMQEKLSKRGKIDVIRILEDTKTEEDFEALTKKEISKIERAMPRQDWIRDLGMDKWKEERDNALQLPITFEKFPVMVTNKDGTKRKVYQERAVLTPEIEEMLVNAIGQDMTNAIQYKHFENWTTAEMEELARRMDRLFKEGRDMLAARKEAEKLEADRIRNLIRDAINNTGIVINEDDPDDVKKKKQDKINKILGINQQLPGSSGNKNEKQQTFIDRLLHSYHDANMRRVARILDNYAESTMTNLLYWQENDCFNKEARAKDRRNTKIDKVIKTNKLDMRKLANVIDFQGTKYTWDEVLMIWAAELNQDDFFKQQLAENEELKAIFEKKPAVALRLAKEESAYKAIKYGNMILDTEREEFRKMDEEVLKAEKERLDKLHAAELAGDEEAIKQYQQVPSDMVDENGNLIMIGTNRLKSVANGRFNSLLEKTKDIYNEFKPLVDAIRKDYSEEFDRINAVSIKEFNAPVWREKWYLPLVRLTAAGDTHEQRLKQDLLGHSAGTGKAGTEKGFTKKRVEIGPMNQTPVELGLYTTWADSVERNEHFIAYAAYIRELNRVLFSRDAVGTMQEIENRYGKAMKDYLDVYVKEVANPNISEPKKGLDKVMHLMRGNTAPAYLGWKFSSVLKQGIESPAPFMQFINPVEYMHGAIKLATDKSWTRESIGQKSAFMKSRVFDPIADLINENVEKSFNKKSYYLKKFQQKGMEGLEWIDWACVAPGWIAIYEKEYARLQETEQAQYDARVEELTEQNDTRYGQYRLTEEQIRQQAHDDVTQNIEEAAVKKADDCVRLCQPSNRKVDLAPMFKNNSEAAKAVLQFQTALNVIWQNIRYDIPYAVRNKEYRNIIGMVLGYVMAGVMSGVVTEGLLKGGDDGEDPEEIAKKLGYYSTTQFIDSVPIVGGNLDGLAKKAITGSGNGMYTSSIWPTFDKYFNSASALVSGDWDKALWNMEQGLMLTTGLPLSGIKELEAVAGIDKGILNFVKDENAEAGFHPEALAGRR